MADNSNPSLPAEELVKQTDPQLLKDLKSLPQPQRDKVLRTIQTAVSFQGPLLPPNMLAEYDRLIPQGADRLMRLLEHQTAHRHEQETRLVMSQTSLSARGQGIGFLLCLFFGIIAWHMATTGHDAVAGVVFGTTIIGLITVFVLGHLPRGQSAQSRASRRTV